MLQETHFGEEIESQIGDIRAVAPVSTHPVYCAQDVAGWWSGLCMTNGLGHV